MTSTQRSREAGRAVFLTIALCFTVASLVACGSKGSSGKDSAAGGSGAGAGAASSAKDDETRARLVGTLSQLDGTAYADPCRVRVHRSRDAMMDGTAPVAKTVANEAKFTIEGIDPGTYFVEIRSSAADTNDRYRAGVYVTKGPNQVDFQIVPGGAIRGSVRKDDARAPRTPVTVHELHEREEQDALRVLVETLEADSDGQFVIDYILPGKKLLVIGSPDKGLRREVEVEVVAGKTHDLGPITLD